MKQATSVLTDMTGLPIRRIFSASRNTRYEAVSRSDVGLVRQINEDRVLALPDEGVFAVSDGMGGHSRGDRAAQAVVDCLTDTSGPDGRLSSAIANLQDTNRKLCAQSVAENVDAMMGATVAALIIDHQHYSCLWAGDSRIYLWRAGKLKRLTTDHSVAQDLVDRGLLDDSARSSHPQSSVLTRAVGASARLSISIIEGHVQPDDRFLLCSDGVCGILSDREIAETLAGCDDETIAESLLKQVMARGAPDNASLVLVFPQT